MAATHSPSTNELVAKLCTIDGKAEIVNGEIVEMIPSGPYHGRVAYRICRSLEEAEQRLGGCAYPDNVGFLVNLPGRKSFSPDAAYDTASPPTVADEDSFVDGAPVFALEVRSKNDYGATAERELADKRSDYFAAGTLVVWDIDLLSEDVVRVYRAEKPTEPTLYRRGEIAAAEPAVAGWTMPVDDLFE